MSYLDQITVGLITYDLQDAAIPSWARASNAPVQSVNNQTGAVVLTAADVSALSANVAIPSDTSDLTNGAGYLTNADIIALTSEEVWYAVASGWSVEAVMSDAAIAAAVSSGWG